MQPKRADIKELREKGVIQEANRLFFHRLGLALETMIHEDGTETLGGIWDYREDEEGLYFNIEERDEDDKQVMREKRDFVANEFTKRAAVRIKMFGSVIEPIN